MNSDDLLTVADIPAELLPHGTASVLTVEHTGSDGEDVTRKTATIDLHGFVREIGPGLNYFPREKWEVIENDN